MKSPPDKGDLEGYNNAMIITSLELKDFRNYENDHKIDFGSGINLLVGNNAQGKTNILEAIYLIATTRSARIQKNSELINFNNSNANVFLRSKSRNGENYFNLQIRDDNSKRIHINGKQIKRATDLLGYLNVVLFSPEDLNIVTGSPSIRRRFLDIFISQVKPSYAVTLSDYNKVLRQRNRLLKDINQKRSTKEMLDIWDEQLVTLADNITKSRFEAIISLERSSNTFYSYISDNQEKLSLGYLSQVFGSDIFNIDQYKTILRDKLNSSRDKDILYGSTSYGPHREDILLKIDEKDAKFFASQGQKRLISLSLKYSEVEYIKEKTAEYPILLFDDVLLELDLSRKHNLLKEMLVKSQIIITTTDLKRYQEAIIEESRIFKINKGRVEKYYENNTH